MEFQPDANWLNGILQLFRDNLQANSNQQLQNVLQQLNKLQTHPEFNNYLAYIVSSCPKEPATLRAQVGLKLKNGIRESWEDFPPHVRQYIMKQVIQTMGCDSPFVRNIVGSIVTTIATKDLAQSDPPRVEGWAQIFAALASMLDSPNPHVLDGALNALSKICEDIGENLVDDVLGPMLGNPLNALIPKFIALFKHADPNVRRSCLGSVNVFLYSNVNALNVNMPQYMHNLFELASNDSDKEVRKRVCKAFVTLLEARYNVLAPNITSVIKFMLLATQDSDEVVALEACEFWANFCDSQGAVDATDRDALKRHLGYLVPVLLKGMMYSEAEANALDAENDSAVPDRQQDIKPRFHHSRAHHEDDDDEGDDDGDNEEATEWNLRKCSAASLDQLAGLYGVELLEILLPELRRTLNSEDWKVSEAAVLALGAVAEGCFEGIKPHLAQLVPFLIQQKLPFPKPLVRSITCWTLSRYARWVVAADQDDAVYFIPLMKELLVRVQDPNKKVQEAACSAFATLEEEAQARLRKYLPAILPHLMAAFKVYQTKNLLILYDAISTLAEAVGKGLNDGDAMGVLMPPLMERFCLMQDGDRTIFPLLECLASIAQASGRGFIPYAEKVFQRCLAMIQPTIMASKQAQAAMARGQDYDSPDKEFIVCALDLLSALAEGLENSVEPLVAGSNILALLFECMQDSDPDVRQSAFALLGDFAKNCVGHLKPHLSMYLPVAAQNLDPQFSSVCNNASWAIGEIAVRCGPEVAPFVPLILDPLIRIIQQPKLMASLLENTAITLGRIGWVCPAQVSSKLDSFCQQWCLYLSRIRELVEKEHAFSGLLNTIAQEPKRILNHFPEFLRAIASCDKMDERMHVQFKNVLQYFKEQLGANWQPVFSRCPPEVQQYLSARYGL